MPQRTTVSRYTPGLVAAVLTLAGCSSHSPVSHAPTMTPAPNRDQSVGTLAARQGVLNELTAKGLVNALNLMGLPAPRAVNTTLQDCPAADCLQSITTDTVRVKSFATPGQAQTYAAQRNLFQQATIVVEFAPPLSTAERRRYEEGIQKLLN